VDRPVDTGVPAALSTVSTPRNHGGKEKVFHNFNKKGQAAFEHFLRDSVVLFVVVLFAC
jgi:hypothetical protein